MSRMRGELRFARPALALHPSSESTAWGPTVSRLMQLHSFKLELPSKTTHAEAHNDGGRSLDPCLQPLGQRNER
jgi:hypothetical protein